MGEWKRDFASGLIVLVPILVTIYALIWLYNIIANLPIVGIIEPSILRVIITLVGFFLALILVGALTRTAAGSVLSNTIDGIINHLPGLRVIYNASKIAVETGVSGNAELRHPVKLQTWDGLRMTAFKTGKYTDDGRMILFLPTSPNITSGYVIEVRPEDVQRIDESVERALTRVISAGFGEPRSRPVTIPVIEEPSTTSSLQLNHSNDGDGNKSSPDPE